MLKLAYLGRGSPVPALSSARLPALVVWLRKALRLLAIADAADAGIFHSTRFNVDLGSGRIAFISRRATMEVDRLGSDASTSTEDSRSNSKVATFAVLNHRFDITCRKNSAVASDYCRGQALAEGAFAYCKSPGGKMEMSTFREAIRMTLDEVDGRLRCHVVQPILQITTLRFRIRYLTKIASSASLLLTTLILSLSKARTTKGIFVQSDDSSDALQLVLSLMFPVAMLSADILECFLLLNLQRQWLLAEDLGRFMCQRVLETPLFCVCLLCVIWHTAMSPVLSQHSLKFC